MNKYIHTSIYQRERERERERELKVRGKEVGEVYERKKIEIYR